jgi:excisionase family DNA binding protein
MNELLTPDEAAEILSLTKKMLKQLADEGRLERVKVGHRTIRYTRTSVENLGGSHM